MKYFSRKTEIVLLVLLMLFTLISAMLVLFSENLMQWTVNFVSEVIHREFNVTKWAATINSLIAFPIFAVIFVTAILFIKFSDKSKITFIVFYGAVILIFTAFCAYTRGAEFMDSDMASEILLAKECFLQKSFWPTTWNYSTEIRLINNQILTAPLFLFTSSWIVVKALSVVLLAIMLPLSLFFLLCQLGIKEKWLIALSCLLILCPWSTEMWNFLHFGSYYVPHIALAFVYIGLFFAISYRNISGKRNTIYGITFYLIAFTSGLAGIRHILYFIFPLAPVITACSVAAFFRKSETFNFKTFFIDDKPLFYAITALFVSGIGYILNSTVLQMLFSFSEWNTTVFTTIGDIGYFDVKQALFEILGYRNRVSVFSPSGIINMLIYVSLAFFIFCLVSFLKKRVEGPKKIFLLFVISMTVFNFFVFINTEFITRYFILPVVFIVPCIACLAEEHSVHPVTRYLMLFCFSIVFISSSFITYGYVLTRDLNSDKHDVAEFLTQSEYEFGYATFWNANVFTYLTDGKLEMATIRQEKIDEKVYIGKTLCYNEWLTPKRYYEDTTADEKKVFLLVSDEEYKNSAELNIFELGKLTYEDEFYRVYEYESNDYFKQCYGETE